MIELLGVVGPLTDPTTHGGTAEDAFNPVLPSLPGYGFSAAPTLVGWDPGRTGRAWAALMHRPGYTRYVAQGGDVGAGVCDAMAIQAPDGLAGLHPQGGKVVTIPLARRTARAIDLAAGERTGGPVFLAADGQRLDRHGAGRIVRRIARQAGSARPSRPTRSGTRSSRPRWMPESRAGRARGRLARGSENDDAV